MQQKNQQTIVVCDDDTLILEIIGGILKAAGYHIHTCEDGHSAVEYIAQQDGVDMLLIDYKMRDINGLDTVELLLKDIDQPFVVITSYIEKSIISKAAALGAQGYIIKPINPDQLLAEVRIAILRAGELQAKSHNSVSYRIINQVVGILSERYKISTDAAFKHLRKLTRDKRMKIGDYTSQVLENHNKNISTERAELNLPEKD